jgi:hypothetical protein
MLLFDVSAVLCMLLDEMICQSFHDLFSWSAPSSWKPWFEALSHVLSGSFDSNYVLLWWSVFVPSRRCGGRLAPAWCCVNPDPLVVEIRGRPRQVERRGVEIGQVCQMIRILKYLVGEAAQ